MKFGTDATRNVQGGNGKAFEKRKARCRGNKLAHSLGEGAVNEEFQKEGYAIAPSKEQEQKQRTHACRALLPNKKGA